MTVSNFNGSNDLVTEYCSFCGNEVTIYAKGVSACPECGNPVVPCSLCYSCNYEDCPYGCTGGVGDQFIPITNKEVLK